MADPLAGLFQLRDLGYPPEVIRQITSVNPDLASTLIESGLEYGSPGAGFAMGDYGLSAANQMGDSDPAWDPEAVAAADADPTTGWESAPDEEPAAPAAPAGSGGDIIDEMVGRYREEFDPIAEQYGRLGGEFAGALGDLAQQYGQDMRDMPLYGGLRDVYEAGGLTDQTRLGLEQSRRDAEQTMRASREAMLQDLAERGVAGGGYEVASAIGDRASAADRQSMRDLETRAFAQEQALGALQGMGEIDADVAATQLDLGQYGAETQFDLGKGVLDVSRDSMNAIFSDIMDQRGEGWSQVQDDVLPAATAGAGALERGSNTEGAATALAGAAGDLGTWASFLTGIGGQQAPGLSTAQPAIPQQPSGDGFNQMPGNILGGLVGGGRALADVFRGGDEGNDTTAIDESLDYVTPSGGQSDEDDEYTPAGFL